jgi:hypothetical protein
MVLRMLAGAMALVSCFARSRRRVHMGRCITVRFKDARHRFAAMRDLGFDAAPASMDPASIAEAQRRGLLAQPPVSQDGLDFWRRLLLASPAAIPALQAGSQ